MDRTLWTLVGLLLMLFVTADLALLRMVTADGELIFPQWPVVAFLTLAFGQTSLAAIYAGLGAGPFLARCGIAAGAVLAWGWMLDAWRPQRDHDHHYFHVSLAVQTLFVWLPLWSMRLTGVRLINTEHGNPSRPFDDQPMQFTLRHLMLASTGLAILLTGLRSADLSSGDWKQLLVISAGFAAVALIAVWTALGTSATAFRPIVLTVLAPSLGVAMDWNLTRLGGIGIFFTIDTAQAALVAGSLWIFRMGGYRMMRVIQPT
jgi:hypothetical protein